MSGEGDGLPSSASKSGDVSGNSATMLAFLEGLMPKEEIGVKRFLQDHPKSDGRGVVIAILDSGVDPGASGLQITTDGKPKIIDVLDCTGSGDIDTSTEGKVDSEGFLTGASGAKLQVNREWTNPSGQWRVGFKHVFDLFPGQLVKRVSAERKKKWSAKQRELVTKAMADVAAYDVDHPKSSDDLVRDDLQARVDMLKKMAEDYDDPGPVLDAVVWHDGHCWRAALDTQDLEVEMEGSGGRLADYTPITNFRAERQYGTLSAVDACNYAVNIYEEGAVLSIVVDSSPHGTHVAGITAAHHPEEPALNGMAPGAQLVSCKIGDSRLEGMETGTGLTRALLAVLENKCDLINMSYGEPTSVSNYGRFIQLANEVVHKHGVIFVSSAGNNGPALTTVGAPGGTSEAILGIGAYVSPAMASSAHSVVEPPSEGLQYTWSSRGPTPDGDVGVNLSAPGGAVAPVSHWTLQRRQLMNGTSMASPAACGGIAVLLSALKAEGRSATPHIVRAALEVTATPVGESPEDELSAGRGVLQVDKAYEYMQRCAHLPDMWFSLTLSNTSGTGPSMRGVYLREPQECLHASEWRVSVAPHFPEQADNAEARIPFEAKLALRCRAEWVKQPDHLLLPHNGRTFNVRVDPSALPPGLHFAQVEAVDLEAPWRGPVFRIPITVLKPHPLCLPLLRFSPLSFTPGHIERRFVEVPAGATWAEASVQLSEMGTPRMFLLHTVQLLPRRRYSHLELKTYLQFGAPSTKHVSFAVEGGPAGATLELTLAQFWSSGSGSPLPAIAHIELSFKGLQPDSRSVVIDGNAGGTRVDVTAPFAGQRLAPAAVLNRVRSSFRPTKSVLQPLGQERDLLPDGRQIHSLTLTYKVALTEGGNYTPRLPLLNGRMYDNELEQQYYAIFDSNKKLVAQGNVYPKAVHLSKGEYSVRLLLRHDNAAHLEKLTKMALLMDRALDEKASLKLGVYSGVDGVLIGGPSMKPTQMAGGERKAVYFAGPAEEKLPKDAVAGTVMLGKVTYGKLTAGGAENGSACPAECPITYVVPQPCKAEEKGSKEKAAAQTPQAMMEKEMRDMKVKLLGSIPHSSSEEKEAFRLYAEDLKIEFPNHLPLWVELVRHHKKKAEGEGGDKASLREVIGLCEKVIALVDTTKLALHFAMKSDAEGPEAAVGWGAPSGGGEGLIGGGGVGGVQKVRKEMEAERDSLVEALYAKGLALDDVAQAPADKDPGGPLAPQGNGASVGEASVSGAEVGEGGGGGSVVVSAAVCAEKGRGEGAGGNEFEANFGEILKWVDVTAPKHAMLAVRRERRAGRTGLAVKALNKMIEEEGKAADKALLELRGELLMELGFHIWADYERRWNLVRFPSAYPLM